jgi:hypothetical protein
MRMKTSICNLLLGIWFTGVLAACGGSDNSSSTPTTPPTATLAEGLWKGTTSTGRTIGGLVLDDGSYWFLYTVIGNPTVAAGLVQGNGISNLGSFTSSNTKDFNLEGRGILDATIASNYVQKDTLSGTITYQGGGTTSFGSSYDADYELAPNMNLVAGAYSALISSNQTVTVTVTSAGTLSGNSTDGCTFTGSFAPRAKGNVFNGTVTFGGGICNNGTDTVNGVAFYDAATQRLYSAAINTPRTNGFIFIGTKL